MKEENTHPVLSISLLCSGRNIEEAKKCLDSLMTIRNRLPSEIIIVDTGCDQTSRILIEKYADRIVDFTWCDDFAKARNAGLEKCSGEWFMFIDDDEWFENTDAIIDFFESGESQHYGMAKYIIRNYTDADGSAYLDTWSLRIERRIYCLTFHGKIHEYLEPKVGETAYLKSYVHHYGYAYKDTAELFRKASRNIPPLIEMIEDEPDNWQWAAQLIQEYKNVHDYSSIEKLGSSYIESVSDLDTANASRFRAVLYSALLFAELKTYQYDKAVSYVNRFLEDNRNSEKCDIGLHYYAVYAYWEKHDYMDAFLHAQAYMEGYDRIRKSEDTSIDDLTFMTGNIFDKDRIMYVISRGVASGVRCGNICALYDYFDRFDLGYKLEPIIPFCDGVTYAFTHYDLDDRFVTYAEKMCIHPYLLSLLVKDASDIEKKSKRDFEKLINVYGRTDDASDPYIIYMRLLYAYRHDREKLIDMYKLVFGCVVDFLDMDPQIWQIAEDAHIDLVPLFKDIPFILWKKGVDIFLEKHFDDEQDVISQIAGIIADDNDLRFRYFRLKLEEMAIASVSDKALAADMLSRYSTDCVTFYLDIYKAELFTGDTTVLPQECQFAMHFIKTVSSEQNHTPTEHIKALEECARLYSPFTDAMKSYIGKYGEKKKAELLKQL